MTKVAIIAAALVGGTTIAWLSGAGQFMGEVLQGRSEPAHGAAPVSSTGTISSEVKVIRGIGYIEPVSEIRRLVFKVDGVIDKCSVAVGQSVGAGSVLVTLKQDDEQAAVAEAEQQLGVAIAERDQLLAGVHPDQISAARRKVELMEEQCRYARKHYQRIENLAEKKATTTQEVDRAETDVKQADKGLLHAEAELANLKNHVRDEDRRLADARVRLAEARLQVARSLLADTIIIAPFNGTVLEILKREGEGARVTDREPILIFADNSLLRVRAEIDERYVHQLAKGQIAEIYGRGLGDQRIKGTVAVVKAVMGNKTVFSHEASERKDLDVLQVLIDLPSSFSAPLGLQVDVEVQVSEVPAADQSDQKAAMNIREGDWRIH